jgi:hypothetical protein
MRTTLSFSLCIAFVVFISTAALAQERVTFSKDVAPILQQRCQVCHHPGTVAPMSLVTYDQARPWAKAIRTKVVAREMPPWFIDKNVCVQPSTSCAFADALSDECDHHGDEGVCGHCEQDSRLTHAAQVHDGEQDDEEQRKVHLVRGERWHGGGQSEDTGRDRNGNGEDVVDEQRRGSDEAWQCPEILFRDDICPAACLVRLDGLDVREHDDREHCCDGQRDRQEEVGRSQ